MFTLLRIYRIEMNDLGGNLYGPLPSQMRYFLHFMMIIFLIFIANNLDNTVTLYNNNVLAIAVDLCQSIRQRFFNFYYHKKVNLARQIKRRWLTACDVIHFNDIFIKLSQNKLDWVKIIWNIHFKRDSWYSTSLLI